MKIGCHVSISGGIENSIYRAAELGINTMQIFSKNSRSWQEKNYSNDEILNFQRAWQKTDIYPIFVHASYLINLASPDEEIYQRSISAFMGELRRADQLLAKIGTPYLIVHPGVHRNAGEESGLKKIVQALQTVLKESSSLQLKTMILLENTSGMGTALGYSFNQLQFIIENTGYADRIGICFDTCHGFAAGYDLTNKKGINNTLNELDKKVGLKKLKVIHINDSKNELNSRKDRHAHIGEGFIGLEGFKILINHKSIKNLPLILETPKESEEDDKKNIRIVRNLQEQEND